MYLRLNAFKFNIGLIPGMQPEREREREILRLERVKWVEQVLKLKSGIGQVARWERKFLEYSRLKNYNLKEFLRDLKSFLATPFE